MGISSPRFVSCAGGGGGGGATPSNLRTNVALLGTIDGVNTVFTTPDTFVHDGTTNEAVYLRGKRVLEGIGNDYTASESGGPGTGYDTITFTQAPKTPDNVLIDYYIDA
jgi:hypothetical protein